MSRRTIMGKTRTEPTPPTVATRLAGHLRELRLPAFRDHYQTQAERAAKEEWGYPQYLESLATREVETRTQGRILRLAKASRLPAGKSWDAFQWPRVPKLVTQQMQTLRDGSFLDRRENVLVFGKPGSGKTHALCALGEQLVQKRPVAQSLHLLRHEL